MAKPDPALLNPARYPFCYRIEPRFGDLDINLHINNVAMASMMEEAGGRFQRASGYVHALGEMTTMVASVSIDYLDQGSYPEPIDFYVAAESVGRTSHVLAKLAIQGERVIAFSRAVLVTVNAHGPAPLPGPFVDQLNPWRLDA